MTSAVAVPMRQGSQEWLDYRRDRISATDLGVILGLNPYRSEATLAREKLGEIPSQPSSLIMRIGTALEDTIAAEYSERTGDRLQRFRSLVQHPTIPWAIASPDRRVIGRRKVVELKWTNSRRYDNGLPDDTETQARWQLGVLGWQEADVAVLHGNGDFETFPIEHDPQTFANLVTVAADFRRRLAAGGPFSEDAASIKARYPADDGTAMLSDAEIEEAVFELLRLRAQRADIEAACDRIETAIKAKMGEHARLVGIGWSVTWKRTKDVEETNWRAIADGLLRQLPEDERNALVSVQTMVRPGPRPFRLSVEKGVKE